MDYSKMTLGELLSNQDDTIKRNAMSILKLLQRGNEQTISVDLSPVACERCGGKVEVTYRRTNGSTELIAEKCLDCLTVYR